MSIEIRFWGVRGSIAAPGPDTDGFGGHTSCVEIVAPKGSLILDAGTGLKSLGLELESRRQSKKTYLIFLSHFHLDHVCGLPFFRPLYQRGNQIKLYGPKGYRRSAKQIIASLFAEELFPVRLNKVDATLRFQSLGEATTKADPFRVESFYVNHPGRTLGYIITAQKKRIAYLSDHEPIRHYRHLKSRTVQSYETKLWRRLQGIDLLIHDAQFTEKQYPRYKGWGHSPWTYPLELAAACNIPQLVLYHHAPDNDDRLLKNGLRRLKRAQRKEGRHTELIMAREGESLWL